MTAPAPADDDPMTTAVKPQTRAAGMPQPFDSQQPAEVPLLAAEGRRCERRIAS
jgi:hypothetical protein